MEVPTKAQLDELQARASSSATGPKTLPVGPPEMPDPEPEVLEAAKLIIEGMLKGEGFGDVVDQFRGQRLAGGHVTAQVDDQLKLKFLAHVLENQPYERSYSLLGGQLVLTFKAVSAEVDRQVASEVRATDPATRDMEYGHGLLAASLQSIYLGGKSVPAMQINTSRSWLERFHTWSLSIDRPMLLLVHRTFRRFERELQELLEKADDPSFWPTP